MQPSVGLTACVFIHEEVALTCGFSQAQARLANLAQAGWIGSVSEREYEEGMTGLIRVGPLGDVPGVSKLVRVYVRDLVVRETGAVLTIRWEATGPGGGLFPALDADITLKPGGDSASILILDGSYRPPLAGFGAGLDKALLRPVAVATVRSLLGRLATAICQPAEAGTGAPDQLPGPAFRPAEAESRLERPPRR